MVKFNRRQFVALGAAGLGAALVGNWLRQETISSEPLLKSSANAAPVYQSSNGLLELDLEAKESPINLSGRQQPFQGDLRESHSITAKLSI